MIIINRDVEHTNQQALKNNEIKQLQQTVAQLNEKLKQFEQSSSKVQVIAKQFPQHQLTNGSLKPLNVLNNSGTSSTGSSGGSKNDSFESKIINETNNAVEMAPSYDTFNLIDRNPILDNEASKFKSVLLKRGSLATRHLPNQQSRDLLDIVNDLSNNTNNNNVIMPNSENNSSDDSLEANVNSNNINEAEGSTYNSGLFAYRQQNTSNNLVFSPSNLNTSPQHQSQQHQPKYSYVVNSFTSPIEDWSCEQVAQWLIINDMSVYADGFVKNSIDGEKLVGLDNSKLKALGVKAQKDRDLIKTKVKDMKADDKKRFKMLLETNVTKKKKLKT